MFECSSVPVFRHASRCTSLVGLSTCRRPHIHPRHAILIVVYVGIVFVFHFFLASGWICRINEVVRLNPIHQGHVPSTKTVPVSLSQDLSEDRIQGLVPDIGRL